MAKTHAASAKNEGCVKQSPVERVGEKLGRDFEWTLRQGFLIRQVLGTGSERCLRMLRREAGTRKGLRGAFNVFLEFVIGIFWFLLHSLALLLAPGYDAITEEDPGDGNSVE